MLRRYIEIYLTPEGVDNRAERTAVIFPIEIYLTPEGVDKGDGEILLDTKSHQ